MSPHIFHMPHQLDAVDPMVLRLRDIVVPMLADATRFRFELCVTEALSNLARHAAPAARDATLRIVLHAKAGEAAIEIFDPAGAAPFDLSDHATALSQVDAMAESGRGLALILDCADGVAYGPADDQTDTQNSLRLVFRDDSLQKDSHK